MHDANCILTRAEGQQAPVSNIQTNYPLQLVIIDYLTVEESIWGYNILLIIVDHFTKFAVAVPTQDRMAETAALAVWKNFILAYSCPAHVHPDQGACFEGKVIELCRLYQKKSTGEAAAFNGGL